MKKTKFLYSLTVLAIIALIGCIISYATGTRPRHPAYTSDPMEKTVPAAEDASVETNVTVKRKRCGCCAERMARYREQMRKARAPRQVKQRAEKQELISQQLGARVKDVP